MTKSYMRQSIKYIFILCLWGSLSGFADQDEISPETLPDEIPDSASLIIHTQPELATEANNPQENEPRNIQSHSEDTELKNPVTPLLPEEPVEGKSPSSRSLKAQIDEELSQPDPSYVPPAPVKPEPANPLKLFQHKQVGDGGSKRLIACDFVRA